MFKFVKKKMLNKFFRSIEEYEITMEELKERQTAGAVVVDVRSQQEYDEKHIDGAINIPEYEINNEVVDILQDNENGIILYCTVGVRSKKAWKKLTKLGYKNVYTLYGGLEQWE